MGMGGGAHLRRAETGETDATHEAHDPDHRHADTLAAIQASTALPARPHGAQRRGGGVAAGSARHGAAVW